MGISDRKAVLDGGSRTGERAMSGGKKRRSNKVLGGELDLALLSNRDVDKLLQDLLQERIGRAIDNLDPDHMIVKGLNENYNSSGEPLAPLPMDGSMVAITNSVRDTSATKRRSILFTIRLSEDDPGEWWAWDENCPTFVQSETVKVGSYRKTCSLHSIPEGAILIQHTILWNGEERERKSVKAFTVENDVSEEGEFLSTTVKVASVNVLRRLPVPPMAELSI